MPAEVRRQNQEPGHDVTGSHLVAQGAKKVTVSDATIGAEYGLADNVNEYWHDRQAQEQKYGQESQFFGGKAPELNCR